MMPRQHRGNIGTLLLVIVVAAACGTKEVSKPESVSARVVGNVDFDGEAFNIVAVTAYLPPNTTFQAWEFRMAYQEAGEPKQANCCVGMKTGARFLNATDMNKVEQFSTQAKTATVEMAFIAPPSVTEATLIYKEAPAGAAMRVSPKDK